MNAALQFRTDLDLSTADGLQDVGLGEQRMPSPSDRDAAVENRSAVGEICYGLVRSPAYEHRRQEYGLGNQGDVDLELAALWQQHVDRARRVADEANLDRVRPRWDAGEGVVSHGIGRGHPAEIREHHGGAGQRLTALPVRDAAAEGGPRCQH